MNIIARSCDAVWGPIGTAPKDGTRILVYDHGIIEVARWGKDGICIWDQWIYGEGGGKFGDTYSSLCSPTHWMPLPPAPWVTPATSSVPSGNENQPASQVNPK